MMNKLMQNIRASQSLIVLVAACGIGVSSAWCEELQTDQSKNTNAVTETASGEAQEKEVTIPQSIFVIPDSPKQGQDPFFPGNDRGATVVPVVKGQKPVAKSGVEELVLQGISGRPERRLCVINGRTLAVGDEEDIVLPSGILRVRCLEINETFVVIELAGVRQELFFKTQQ